MARRLILSPVLPRRTYSMRCSPLDVAWGDDLDRGRGLASSVSGADSWAGQVHLPVWTSVRSLAGAGVVEVAAIRSVQLGCHVDVQSGEGVVELVEVAGADDGCGDGGVCDGPRDGEAGGLMSGFVGDDG